MVDEERCGKRLQRTKSYRSLASGDTHKITTEDGKLEDSKQLHIERMETTKLRVTKLALAGSSSMNWEEAQDLMGEVSIEGANTWQGVSGHNESGMGRLVGALLNFASGWQ